MAETLMAVYIQNNLIKNKGVAYLCNLKNDVYIEYDINCSRRPIVFADEPIILYDLLNPKIPRIRL